MLDSCFLISLHSSFGTHFLLYCMGGSLDPQWCGTPLALTQWYWTMRGKPHSSGWCHRSYGDRLDALPGVEIPLLAVLLLWWQAGSSGWSYLVWVYWPFSWLYCGRTSWSALACHWLDYLRVFHFCYHYEEWTVCKLFNPIVNYVKGCEALSWLPLEHWA